MSEDRGATLSLIPEGGAPASPPGPLRRDSDPDAFASLFALLRSVADWCYDRTDRIGGCYIEHTPDGLALHVVGKQTAFDFHLNRELADFTITLVARGFRIYSHLVPASAPVQADEFGVGHMVYQLRLR
jgi:hypothetical protein